MTYVNELTGRETSHPEDLQALALLLAPFAPHFGEEVWRLLGLRESIFREPWPGFDEALCRDETVNLVVQVNGKKRATCVVPAGVDAETALRTAKEAGASWLEGKTLVKEIFVPRTSLVNLVVK